MVVYCCGDESGVGCSVRCGLCVPERFPCCIDLSTGPVVGKFFPRMCRRDMEEQRTRLAQGTLLSSKVLAASMGISRQAPT